MRVHRPDTLLYFAFKFVSAHATAANIALPPLDFEFCLFASCAQALISLLWQLVEVSKKKTTSLRDKWRLAACRNLRGFCTVREGHSPCKGAKFKSTRKCLNTNFAPTFSAFWENVHFFYLNADIPHFLLSKLHCSAFCATSFEKTTTLLCGLLSAHSSNGFHPPNNHLI